MGKLSLEEIVKRQMVSNSKEYSFSIFAGASLELPKILIVCPGVTAQFIAMKDQLISLPSSLLPSSFKIFPRLLQKIKWLCRNYTDFCTVHVNCNVSPSADSDSSTSSYLDWLLEHTKRPVLEIQTL